MPGSIVRAAEAFGASGVIFIKGSVSPYNPKAIRGFGRFDFPCASGRSDLTRRWRWRRLSQRKLDIYAAMPQAPIHARRHGSEAAVRIHHRQRGTRRQFGVAEGALHVRIPTSACRVAECVGRSRHSSL